MQHFSNFITQRAPWTPDNIATLLWLDATDASTITESLGLVSEWRDKKGSGEDFVQATGTKQMSTGTRTINGLNVLDGDGARYMTKTLFPVPASGDIAIFMVCVFDVVDHANDAAFGLKGTGDINDFQVVSNSATQWNGNIAARDISGQPTTNVNFTGGPFPGPQIINANFDFAGAGIFNAFVDGTQRAVDTAYTVKLNTEMEFRLFVNRNNGQRPDGAIAEVIATEDVTLGTRQKIEGYLAHKWGLA